MQIVRSRTLAPLALSALLLSTSACSPTWRLGDLTLLSTRPVNLDHLDLDQLPATRVVGEDREFLHPDFFYPAFFPTLSTAVDNALGKGGGDLLIDVVVEFSLIYAVFGNVAVIRVKGDVVDTRQRPAAKPSPKPAVEKNPEPSAEPVAGSSTGADPGSAAEPTLEPAP